MTQIRFAHLLLRDTLANKYALSAVQHSNLTVRRYAVEALGKIGNKENTNHLVTILNDPKNAELRGQTALALGKIGDIRAFDALQNAQADPDSNVRKAAEWALSMLAEPAVKVLIQHLQLKYSFSEETSIKRQDIESIQQLIYTLRHMDHSTQSQAAWSLAKIGEPTVRLLVDTLKEKDEEVKTGAMLTLGMIGSPAINQLIEMLSSPDVSTRSSAITTLIMIGKPVIDPIAKIVNHNDWHVRLATVFILGKIGDPRGTPSLIIALKDKDIRVRTTALAMLTTIDAPAVKKVVEIIGKAVKAVRNQPIPKPTIKAKRKPKS